MSAKALAETFRTLEAPDFRVLSGLELAHGSYAHPPVEEIRKYANLPLDEVRFRLDLLDKKGLLGRARVHRTGYKGYFLTYAGYDCLALNALVKAGAVEALGRSLGIGKEADVYEGIRGRRRVTLKFHRIGRTSFRQTRRTRGFVADRSHTTWIYQSRLAAQKEFQALKLAYRNKVSVPRPIAHNRHLLVMGIIIGLELNDVGTIDAPEIVLNSILLNIRRAYLDAHIIHGDLSEYNVMVKKDGRVLIIDWPQFIYTNHPNAPDMLTRDIGNILSFFKRRFRVEYILEQVLTYVKGESQQPRSESG
jgi:RIO kinase 2